MTRWDARATLCGNCGHWSESSESGLTPGSGYCAYWEKIKDRSDTCDHYVSRREYRRWQERLAAQSEEWLDD